MLLPRVQNEHERGIRGAGDLPHPTNPASAAPSGWHLPPWAIVTLAVVTVLILLALLGPTSAHAMGGMMTQIGHMCGLGG